MINEPKIHAQTNLDFDGLAELKAKASGDDSETAREVGNQFEAMFVQMMLKSMREASEPLKSKLFDTKHMDTFEEMYHGELAQEISKNGPLGIGEWLIQRLQDQGHIQYNKSSDLKNQLVLNDYKKFMGQINEWFVINWFRCRPFISPSFSYS